MRWKNLCIFQFLFLCSTSILVKETVRVLNGTTLTLECEPAELLVKTHMAPDFENPQLVRRLDWFHDDAIIATFQQETVAENNKQWWIAGTRYELRKPFFELRISPTLPEDSGMYKCRLDTDPLFASDSSSSNIPLLVMVKPPTPGKPQLAKSTENSLTISWTQSAGAAHRPLLRYSVLINQLDDENLRVIATKGNHTSITIDSLLPYTRYKLSLRAENHAGNSEFGPEGVFRTLGEAPKHSPSIQMIRNGTAGCVDVNWKNSPLDHVGKPIVGYRIMVHRAGTGAMREWYVKTHRQSLCSLIPFTDYTLSIETDNGFGYSPAATTNFRSEEAVPDGPPESIEVRPLSGESVMIMWTEPSIPNGQISSYQIYFKKLNSNSQQNSLIRLVVQKDASRTFVYNLTKLEPSTAYQIQLSASTGKGESDKSSPLQVTTDYAIPQPPQITNISYECGNEIRIAWSAAQSQPISFYRIFLDAIAGIEVAHQTINTTKEELLIKKLAIGQKYSLKISSVLKSRYDNLTEYESSMSKHEIFMINPEKCLLQSSICSPTNQNCEAIAVAGGQNPTRNASVLLVLLGVTSFGLTFLLIVLYFKRRCVLVKKILKKADKKANIHETVSLVYEINESSKMNAVTVSRFEKHVEELALGENEGYRREFEQLESDLETQSDGSNEEQQFVSEDNRLKNRYLNILPNETTRVRIHSATNGTPSKGCYINANYIDSCDERRVYIATQAPLPQTFCDFYAMVWQEKCNVIVVITNLVERGKRKCDQYWPATTKTPLAFGNLQVTLNAEMQNANFVHRILSIRSLKNLTVERIVHQVHLTSWPDHGVPNTVFPLLSFVNYVADIQSTGPIVVHCSAGVGRSGSYILIDSMRRHLLKCDSLNIFAHLKHIRRQRQRLVQTLDQYIFCHEVVRELIRHGITRQSVPHFPNYLQFLYHQILPDGRSRLQMQYEEVCKCPHMPNCRVPIGCAKLPGYHCVDEFIVGNWPHECTELWKEVWENQCETVVLFGSEAEVGDYFKSIPQRGKTELSTACGVNTSVTIGKKTVQLQLDKPIGAGELVVRREDSGHVLLKSDSDEVCIKVVRLRPSDLELHTWTEIERIQDQAMQNHRSKMMLVDPSNSAMPFVICALQSIACQLEQERFVDVLHFLAAYRLQCCGCWQAQSNIDYVYEKVLELIQLHRPS